MHLRSLMLGVSVALLVLGCRTTPVPVALDRAELLQAEVAAGDKNWANFCAPKERFGIRALFTYALTLAESGAHPERLETLFDIVARMQDRNPASRHYGNFYWYSTATSVQDTNAVDFCMLTAAPIWLRHRDELTPAAREKLRTLLDLAGNALLHRKPDPTYTNIALMNATDLILVGEGLGRQDLVSAGQKELDILCRELGQNGIHEFDSPTYHGVVLVTALTLEALAGQECVRRQARAILELFWTDVAANWHPGSQRLCGANSRSYDYLSSQGEMDAVLLGAGWINREQFSDSFHWINLAQLGRWTPPPALKRMAEKQFPRLVQQSWGPKPENFRIHQLHKDVTLSTTGSGYGGWMDVPLTVDLPDGREGLRGYFIPDGRHDPYGKNKIAAGAHAKAFHLQPFFAGTQRNDDALALAVYRAGDVPKETQALESHFVLPLKADAFWIGNRRIEAPREPVTIPLNAGEPLILRRGTAAAGVRVLVATALDSGDAPVSFIYDGNPFGAVRLTVQHGTPPGKSPAGVALWVRIGSGLVDDAAFERWRVAFSQATPQVTSTPEKIALHVDAPQGELALGVAAPFTECFQQSPLPPRTVLSIDGKDVGRKIMQAVAQ